jgi:hypothetical protein
MPCSFRDRRVSKVFSVNMRSPGGMGEWIDFQW